ncbi:hypothetical protein IQ279_02425 [Streptomyces verrucosisporus]|nr:hypothetical protein [Streptomyces verrucosisporus]
MRRLLRATTIAACLPYLALKTAWLCGLHIGIPEGSAPRAPENTTSLALANSLTVAMDAAVVALVLVLALTLPRGRRLPAWLTALPLWTATGLLTPIAIAVPVLSLLAAAAATGVLLLAFPTGRAASIRLRTAVALAWTGSSVLATRGGWSLLTGVFNDGMVDPSRQDTALMTLTYSVEVLAGMLVLATGAHLFAERAARPATGRTPAAAHPRHTAAE